MKESEPITSQFFVCKNIMCDGAFCLRCEKFLEKKDMESHICSLSPLEDLYRQVLDVLARGGSRPCPVCGVVGKKDLACTHITCMYHSLHVLTA